MRLVLGSPTARRTWKWAEVYGSLYSSVKNFIDARVVYLR